MARKPILQNTVPTPAPVALPERNRVMESDIEAKVCRYAEQHGWYVRKFTSPNHRSVPDRMFASRRGAIVYIEFKRPGEHPTDKQRREICRLLLHNQDVAIVDDVEEGKGILAMLDGGEPFRLFLATDHILRIREAGKIAPEDRLPVNRLLRIERPLVG